MRKNHVQPNATTYALVLNALCRLRQPNTLATEIINVYNDALSEGYRQNLFTHTAIIRVLCERDHEVHRKLRQLQHQEALGSEGSNVATRELSILRSEKNKEVAFQMYNYTKQQLLFIDAFTCDMLLRMAVERRCSEEALNLYEDMKQNFILCTPYTLGYVMAAQTQMKSLEDLQSTFDLYCKLCQQRKWAKAERRSVFFVLSQYLSGLVTLGQIKQARAVLDGVNDLLALPAVSPVLCNIILGGYVSLGQPDQARHLYQQMIQGEYRGVQPTAATYNQLVNGLLDHHKFDMAYEYFTEAQARGFTLRYRSYNLLLQTALELRKEDEIIVLLEAMVHWKIYPNHPSCSVLCRHLVSLVPTDTSASLPPFLPRLIKHAIRTYVGVSTTPESSKRMHDVNYFVQMIHNVAAKEWGLHALVYSAVIEQDATLNKQVAQVIVQGFYRTVPLQDQPLSYLNDTVLHHYFQLLLTCARYYHTEALKLFVDALLERISRSWKTVPQDLQNMAESYLQRANNELTAGSKWSEGSELVIPQLKTCHTPSPNPFTWGPDSIRLSQAIIDSDKLGDLNNMIRIFSEMESQRLIPTHDAIGIYLHRLTQKRANDQAIHVLRTSHSMAASITNATARSRFLVTVFSTAIVLYSKMGRVDQVQRYLSQAAEQDVFLTPTANAYALLALPLNSETTSLGFKLFRQMRNRGTKVSTFFMNTLLSAIIRTCHQLDELVPLYQYMVQTGIAVDSYTMWYVVEGCLKRGALNEALEYFESFRVTIRQNQPKPSDGANKLIPTASHQVSHGVQIYNSLLRFAVDQSKGRALALRIYHALLHDGVVPNWLTYLLLLKLNACLAPINLHQATQFFSILKGHFQPSPPPAEVYNILIKAWGVSVGNPNKALQWYDQLLQAKVEPTLGTYQALTNTLAHTTDPTAVDRITNILETLSHTITTSENHHASTERLAQVLD
ncbi:hypothetical protein IWQ62_003997 [Dispira parvispora]|uniref:Uncharacterized protein n=1 Tax=Dispira parvispora TaxID=1520584 RepID=A0A9W8AT90_9FUNG|nr:hypothetical protein IWQ62_003997 [Dispira parvispora]